MTIVTCDEELAGEHRLFRNRSYDKSLVIAPIFVIHFQAVEIAF